MKGDGRLLEDRKKASLVFKYSYDATVGNQTADRSQQEKLWIALKKSDSQLTICLARQETPQTKDDAHLAPISPPSVCLCLTQAYSRCTSSTVKCWMHKQHRQVLITARCSLERGG